MQLTTSLWLLRYYQYDMHQYALLFRALGPDWEDAQPILLTQLLDLHGMPGWEAVANTIEALHATPMEQNDAGIRIAANYCLVALENIPGPPEHKQALHTLRSFIAGTTSIEMVQKAAWAIINHPWEIRKVDSTPRSPEEIKTIQFSRGCWTAWAALRSHAAAEYARLTRPDKEIQDLAILRSLLEEEAQRDL